MLHQVLRLNRTRIEGGRYPDALMNNQANTKMDIQGEDASGLSPFRS